MKNFTDDELIEEIKDRQLVWEVAKELDDDDLCEMVRHRDLEDAFSDDNDFNEEEERERIEEETDKQYKLDHHILHKDFDRFQLREHLVDITRLHSYASEDKIFSTLRELLEFI